MTAERKVEILSRAHRILTEEVGFDSTDIIFDPNILTVATGIEEHDDYAVSFIEAARELRRRFAATTRYGRRCTLRSSTTRSARAWTWESSMPAS